MSSDALFRSTAPRYMRQFMADFDCTLLDAAAVFGNAGHESAGFTKLQEVMPRSGRGGWGWFQWTGPRRVAFEAYCKKHGKDPANSDANYAWLFVELTGEEKGAIAPLKAAPTLPTKVMAFEQHYERAGVKSYDSRLKWANIAIEAFNEEPAAPPAVPSPAQHTPSLIELIIRAIAALFSRK